MDDAVAKYLSRFKVRREQTLLNFAEKSYKLVGKRMRFYLDIFVFFKKIS